MTNADIRKCVIHLLSSKKYLNIKLLGFGYAQNIRVHSAVKTMKFVPSTGRYTTDTFSCCCSNALYFSINNQEVSKRKIFFVPKFLEDLINPPENLVTRTLTL